MQAHNNQPVNAGNLLMILLLLLLPFFPQAQQQPGFRMSGTAVSGNRQPASFATIVLLPEVRDSVLKITMADSLGRFSFANLLPGTYRLQATLTGYEPVVVPVTLGTGDLTVDAIVIDKQMVKDISNVVIVSKRPFIERKADKLVVNVEDRVSAVGNTVLDMLQKMPGVTVDNDGNIMLNGRSGISVQINGRRVALAPADLASMLRSMPAERVRAVEIMSNPSSRYEAGSTGIINIVLKRSTKKGFSGTANIGAGYGENHKFSAGTALYFNTGAWQSYCTIDFGNNNNFRISNLDRQVADAGNIINFDQGGKGLQKRITGNITAGTDYFVTKKTSLGISLTAFQNITRSRDHNDTYIYNANWQTDSSLFVDNNEYRRFNGYSANAHYVTKIDSAGSQFTFDADYARYDNKSDERVFTNYFTKDGGSLRADSWINNITATQLDIYSLRGDLTLAATAAFKLETGAKASWINAGNDFGFLRYQAGLWQNDPARSNFFKYDENILAAYVSGTYTWKTMSIQAGLRGENTRTTGLLVNDNQQVKRSYFNLFPTFYLTKQFTPKHELSLSYSRRIDRPDYNTLNPFLYFNDEYSYQQGNPYLNPEYTGNIELGYTFNSALNISLSYAQTRQVITPYTEQDDATRIIILTNKNLDTRRSFVAGISMPVKQAKWWNAFYAVQALHQRFSLGVPGSDGLNNNRTAYQLYTSQEFTLPRQWLAEISFDYQSPVAYGIYTMSPLYGLDLGIRKRVKDGRLTLRLNVNDILQSRRTVLRSDFANLDVRLASRRETRFFKLTATYNLKKQQQRARSGKRSGNEGERRRVKEDN